MSATPVAAPPPPREPGPLFTAHAASDATPGAAHRPRLDALDLLRGLVMVIMLLDHTRDFAHVDAFRFDASDLTQTNVALYFTRWVTHFCAPVFVFLAGTGAYLQRLRGRPAGELSRYLVTRGLWLIVLEFTAVRFGYSFNLDYSFAGLMQVIWVIGVSMIVLAALVRLPTAAIGALGVAMIALHNLLDGVTVAGWRGPGTPLPSALDKLWLVLHQGGVFPVASFPGPVVVALYPLIPWVGVMMAGYAFGAVYTMEPEPRRRFLLRLGLALTVAFVALRAVNVYGDPSPWSPQRDATFTLLSFLKVDKYPPSLLFLLMTLGPAIVLVALLERRRQTSPLARALVTFGRVPLFYYLLQWIVAHGLAVVAGALAGEAVAWHFANLPERGRLAPPDAGFSLPVVYLLWLIGLAILYPLCRWYAGVKARRRDWWLSYL